MKKAHFFLVIVFIVCAFIQFPACAKVIRHTVHFNKSDLVFSQLFQHDIIKMKGLELSYEVGSPQLPFCPINLMISDGEKIERIEIKNVKYELLDGYYDIVPVQKPQVLSISLMEGKKVEFTKPNALIYSYDNYYPENIIKILGNSYVGNVNLASLCVYPLQYQPIKRKIKFYSEITFQITTRSDQNISMKTLNFGRTQSQILTNLAKNLLLESEQTYIFDQKETQTIQNENYQYVIITSSVVANHFKPLSEWKTKKGVPAKIVTVEWIYSNFEGIDNPEKIRNFIRYAYENWSTIWILLGGDVNIVPHRTAFAMDCEFGGDPRENEIPCDLYYADLDGTWNNDGDDSYGEISDNVDLYPEVIIGRAPVENAAEADIFVNKIIGYEKNPPLDYQRNMLFAAAILWHKPYTNTGIAKDMIEEESLAAGFYNITKLYEHTGNESVESVRNAINRGQNIINHHGHANTAVMGMGQGSFRISDMEALMNGSKQAILYSIGCYPANFEADCIAETFVNNPNGGGVAFIGNSRYGWGSPGNPGYGYSDRFDAQFFRFLFKQKNHNIGKAIALAKAYYVPYARQENVYRWCMYEINLLGDPEMPVWTDIPDTLTVQYPLVVTTGTSQVPITVTKDGLPIKNALVCLMQGEDIYQYGETNENGQIAFKVAASNPAKEIMLTVTALNFLPYERSIDIVSDAAYILCSKFEIDDHQGNGDGLINPGEKVNLKLRFKNYGNIAASNVTTFITSTDSLITIEDANISTGDIAGGDSVDSSDPFVVTVDATCINGHVFQLDMTISESGGHEWNQILSLTCATPVFSFDYNQINDSEWGNGNGIPEPGEKITLFLSVHNLGLAIAKSVQSSITCNDPKLAIEPISGSFGDIAACESSMDSVTIEISNAYSNLPAFPKIILNLSTQDGYAFALSFNLTVGRTGFEDNVETGQGNWQIPDPAINHWHISSRKHHSGSYSWYCGDKTSGDYFHDDDCILESPPFYLGQEAQLSLWAWYNVAIYGVNGFYVQVSDDGGSTWHNLDFIGSGGALDSTLIGNDWLPYRYDLSQFEPGTLAKVRFHWVSDSEPLPPGEISGVFIDDVMVTSQLMMSIKSERIDLLPIPTEYKLFQNYPNPFNSVTKINYQIVGHFFQELELTIFNLLAQKVKTLVKQRQAGGYYTVLWDGKNDFGEIVSSGIYVCQLKVSGVKMEKKLVVIR